MACSALTKGRLRSCKDSVGGLKHVYFVDYESVDFSVADEEVTAVDLAAGVSSASVFKYDVKGTSSFTQNIQASLENRTVAFEQVLELTLHKLTKEDHKEIKLLSFGSPHIFVEDFNGNVFLAGKEHGMEVTGGTVVTGTAMSDMSGYTLTFTGMEVSPSEFIASGATPDGENDLAAVLGSGVEIVAGA